MDTLLNQVINTKHWLHQFCWNICENDVDYVHADSVQSIKIKLTIQKYKPWQLRDDQSPLTASVHEHDARISTIQLNHFEGN